MARAILCPQPFVVRQVISMETVKVVNAFFRQVKINVQLPDGGTGIGIKIPQRMVKVKKQVFIFHGAGSRFVKRQK
jgi:hypothetical protein